MRSRTASGKKRLLARLEAGEAREVLVRLLSAHPELREEAESIARSYLSGVDFESIAEEVQYEVSSLDVRDLHGRAGKQEWGYVEPGEAAWEILQETVDPYVADMKRRMELDLEAEALEICKGVALGLYQVEHTEGSELVQWAEDFPAEAACEVIRAWLAGDKTKNRSQARSRRSRRALPVEFIQNSIPEWRDMIERSSSP